MPQDLEQRDHVLSSSKFHPGERAEKSAKGLPLETNKKEKNVGPY